MSDTNINTLFLDIGGVLLTDGWNHHSRQDAAEKFDLDYEEINERHDIIFHTFEEGKISLDTYLDKVFFYESRSFSKEEFKDFIFSQSQPHEEMIAFIRGLKEKYDLRFTAVSNEGREINEYRIKTFKLNEFIDAFVSSSYVHIRKPDYDMFRLALDFSQVKAEQVIFIDDRKFHTQIAADLGIHPLHHTGLKSTRNKLKEFGFEMEDLKNHIH